MKTILNWGALALILIIVNLMILSKERTLADGRTVLLKLAPRDPRSLMQGDYMVLRYDLARKVRAEQLVPSGKLVLQLDKDGAGTFVRLENGMPLNRDEQLLVYRKRKSLRIGAESFFFEEGSASRFERGVFGELKVDASGNSVLVGLRDKDLNQL
jgi:uncharacterized membrane-anchored protein